MIIINADDWGRSRKETEAAFSCFRAGRINSASAMVFMADSERAADLANEAGIDVGLHLNLSQPFTGECRDHALRKHHDRIVHFLTKSKYSVLLYNPALRKQFRYVYHAQVEEFLRLYGKPPSHVDGHHHKHLCVNMVLDRVIPEGEKVRRNFSFRPGEKGFMNRAYRRVVDQWLARRYRLTDFFFALPQLFQSGHLSRLIVLSGKASIEVMVHPAKADDLNCLTSEKYREMLSRLRTGTYSSL